MGRTDDLREKFRKKAESNRPDPNLLLFKDMVNGAIAHKSAQVLFSSNEWLLSLRDKSKEVPEEKMLEWLRIETEGLFLSVDKKPHWRGDTTWCFHLGMPLTFVGQMPDSADADSSDIYVFSGTAEDPDNSAYKRRYFKLLIQDEDSEARSDEIIWS